MIDFKHLKFSYAELEVQAIYESTHQRYLAIIQFPLLAKVAKSEGMKAFHLGGGVGSGEDNLFKFKISFNKNSDYQFSIGKQVFDQEKYDELVEIRALQDYDFNPESKFFPLYRS